MVGICSRDGHLSSIVKSLVDFIKQEAVLNISNIIVNADIIVDIKRHYNSPLGLKKKSKTDDYRQTFTYWNVSPRECCLLG